MDFIHDLFLKPPLEFPCEHETDTTSLENGWMGLKFPLICCFLLTFVNINE